MTDPTYYYKESLDNNNLKQDVWKLLVESDNEFIPSLSSRSSTADVLFKQNKPHPQPENYFKSILNQHFIIAEDLLTNQVLGFLSFIENYMPSESLKKFSPNNYVSTICVSKNYRGKGLANSLYEFLENRISQNKKNHYLITRTWSSNQSHIKLLAKRKFHEVERIVDDRGIGLDTVFYAKEMKQLW